MNQKFYPIQMEIAGDTAIWTRPDTGDCPCSYPVPTYSAVKAIFESVLWGPDITIIPRKVEICSPIRYHSYVTNYLGPLRKKGATYQLYATVLIDVCYRFYADVCVNPSKTSLPEAAWNWDRKTTSPGHAYQEIFNRRLLRGQSYASPCLGWKEFTPSYFGPFREQSAVCSDLQDIFIPSMLRETFTDGYRTDFHPSYDNKITIHQGVMIFPERRHET